MPVTATSYPVSSLTSRTIVLAMDSPMSCPPPGRAQRSLSVLCIKRIRPWSSSRTATTEGTTVLAFGACGSSMLSCQRSDRRLLLGFGASAAVGRSGGRKYLQDLTRSEDADRVGQQRQRASVSELLVGLCQLRDVVIDLGNA